MYMLIYSLLFLAFFTFLWVVPRRRQRRPPPRTDDGDDGGEPRDTGLPDLDLPPGVTLPINDWEPDYNRPRVPVK